MRRRAFLRMSCIGLASVVTPAKALTWVLCPPPAERDPKVKPLPRYHRHGSPTVIVETRASGDVTPRG